MLKIRLIRRKKGGESFEIAEYWTTYFKVLLNYASVTAAPVIHSSQNICVVPLLIISVASDMIVTFLYDFIHFFPSFL